MLASKKAVLFPQMKVEISFSAVGADSKEKLKEKRYSLVCIACNKRFDPNKENHTEITLQGARTLIFCNNAECRTEYTKLLTKVNTKAEDYRPGSGETQSSTDGEDRVENYRAKLRRRKKISYRENKLGPAFEKKRNPKIHTEWRRGWWSVEEKGNSTTAIKQGRGLVNKGLSPTIGDVWVWGGEWRKAPGPANSTETPEPPNVWAVWLRA
ncbi:MAG: hypothetical protein GY710_07520, partial [Desulfobacteraceae bacterium]|nr:hypothetical protein [Desulfobacteraceae bacterium]